MPGTPAGRVGPRCESRRPSSAFPICNLAARGHVSRHGGMASYTCVAGQRCLLEGVRGIGLDTTDNWLLLETCGIATLPSAGAEVGRERR